MKEKEEKITISLKEYKELLEIKGRYEELKLLYRPYYTPTITWTKYNDKDKDTIITPYTYTCGDKND